MKRNKKQNIKLLALILILLLGIGYAALKTTLKIDGTVNVDKTTWNVHFENVSIIEGSVTANPAPTTNNTDTTEMTYTINFTKPGDFFEFTVDIVNAGTIDAMVNSVTNKTYNVTGTTEIETPTYLINAVNYDDDIEIAPNHLLEAGESEKIKVRIEFKKDISSSDLPSSGDTSIVFKFKGDYKQADENACQRTTTFENDSWDTIECNVKNNPQSYPVGATKTIEMDLDGDNTNETYTLRVANNTTPAECGQTDFSQTACGFVIEFKDIISKHRMNPSGSVNSTGNRGGWKDSDMRSYLNSTTYAYENINYSSTGIYNALPAELKNKIIDTEVVSGHGSEDTSNFKTTDKLYLLSTKEVFGKEELENNLVYNDSAEVETRQLDYYKEKAVTTLNYYDAIKRFGNSTYYWWLRTANDGRNYAFYNINTTGTWSNDNSEFPNGVSPAFRIG